MKLYVIATPIGNLEDISLRALRILSEVDLILSEDTRVTRKLLDHYGLKKPLLSFHQHSGDCKYQKILQLLNSGQSLALVSDAGTPNISDPGGELVDYVRRNLPALEIEAIPGPSAITAALSVAGIKADRFSFFGFLPHKKGRSTLIKEIMDHKYPVVLYESKHRIAKLLQELKAGGCQKKVMIFRELTKMFYTFYNQDLDELCKILEQDREAKKGEFTLIIY